MLEPVGTRTLVLVSRLPKKPSVEFTSIRSVLSLEVFPSVVVFLLELLFPPRWNAPLSSVVTTFTTSRSTTVMRRDTVTWLPIALLASSASKLVMLLLLVSAGILIIAIHDDFNPSFYIVPSPRLFVSTSSRSRASVLLVLKARSSPSSKCI